MEKLMKILRYGWMYVIVAVFVISMSGCAPDSPKADAAPAAEEQKTEAPASELNEDAATPTDAVEASESGAESEADGVRDDISVKGAK